MRIAGELYLAPLTRLAGRDGALVASVGDSNSGAVTNVSTPVAGSIRNCEASAEPPLATGTIE